MSSANAGGRILSIWKPGLSDCPNLVFLFRYEVERTPLGSQTNDVSLFAGASARGNQISHLQKTRNSWQQILFFEKYEILPTIPTLPTSTNINADFVKRKIRSILPTTTVHFCCQLFRAVCTHPFHTDKKLMAPPI